MKSKNDNHIFFDFFFCLKPEFLALSSLLNQDVSEIPEYTGYQSQSAKHFDQLFIKYFYKEYTRPSGEARIILHDHPSLLDNYRFVKRHFGLKGLLYVFFFGVKTPAPFFNHLICLIRSLTTKKFKPEPLKEATTITVNNHPPKRVSVIIPTLGRYAHLNKLLGQLAKQTIPPDEIIVADQNDNPKILTPPQNVQLVHLKLNHKGLSFSKNKGAESAKGEYLLFLDDDCEIEDTHVAAHLQAFLSYPELAVSSGNICENIDSASRLKNKTGYRQAQLISTCCCMVSAEVFKRFNGFNPSFDAVPLEDTDFYHRLMLDRQLVLLNLAAFCFHQRALSGGIRNRINNFDQYLSFYLQPAVLRYWEGKVTNVQVIRICQYEYYRALKYYTRLYSWPFNILIILKLHLKSRKFWQKLRKQS